MHHMSMRSGTASPRHRAYPAGSFVGPPWWETTRLSAVPASSSPTARSCRPSLAPAMTTTTSADSGLCCGGLRSRTMTATSPISPTPMSAVTTWAAVLRRLPRRLTCRWRDGFRDARLPHPDLRGFIGTGAHRCDLGHTREEICDPPGSAGVRWSALTTGAPDVGSGSLLSGRPGPCGAAPNSPQVAVCHVLQVRSMSWSYARSTRSCSPGREAARMAYADGRRSRLPKLKKLNIHLRALAETYDYPPTGSLKATPTGEIAAGKVENRRLPAPPTPRRARV